MEFNNWLDRTNVKLVTEQMHAQLERLQKLFGYR